MFVQSRRGTIGDGQVMSHEVNMILLEVYHFNLASTGGQRARTIVAYSPSGPHPPGRSPSKHFQNDGLQAVVRPALLRMRTDWRARNTSCTRYQDISSSKEANSAFEPLSQTVRTNWPTLL